MSKDWYVSFFPSLAAPYSGHFTLSLALTLTPQHKWQTLGKRLRLKAAISPRILPETGGAVTTQASTVKVGWFDPPEQKNTRNPNASWGGRLYNKKPPRGKAKVTSMGRSRQVKAVLRSLEGFLTGTFTLLPKTQQSSRRKAVVNFASSAHAAKAVATLDLMGKQPTLGNQPLHAEQVLSAKFKLLNPVFRGRQTLTPNP